MKELHHTDTECGDVEAGSIYVVMRSFLKKSEILKNKLVPLHPRMRSLRPLS